MDWSVQSSPGKCPKFAKTIYLDIDNGPSKLRFGTALVLRMSSGVNLV